MRAVTTIVILAAGASRRLGRPKQMEMLGGETLLARAVRVARAAALGPVCVVVNADDALVVQAADALDGTVVLNREATEGMASSIRAGVGAAGEAEALLVMTCDQPAVTAEHLRRLAEEADGGVIASAYGDRVGVPAWFPASVFPELLALTGDAGARELLRGARSIALEHGELDIDTFAELERARLLFGA